MAMANVQLKDVERRFSTATAVEDISFAVPEGQFWVLVGPSGCGKSTILRMVAGLDFPTQGEIYIGDRLVNNLSARERDVAMVFQNYALYPHMTVAENLAFGLKMRHVDRAQVQQRVRTVAESLDLMNLLNRKPKQLSGGQQQRVALGRAIVRQPQVFLLDEPLSNLDAQLREDTRAELKRLHQQVGVTTLYVTHDQTEAMTLADRTIVLSQGQIQQIGTPHEIYQNPANRMVASFLGNPPMNLLSATYEDGAFWVGRQKITCPPQLQKALGDKALGKTETIDLGIRPEHLQIGRATENSLTVTVEVIEPLGRETLLRTQLATQPSQPLNLIADSTFHGQPQTTLTVTFNPENLVAFDPRTGLRF
jgi:multiple sugar transport system ATP-binding protein